MAVEKYTNSRGRVSYRFKDAHLRFCNFEGKEGMYNDKGNRNFNIELDKDDADFLTNEGFNVRVLEPKTDNSDPMYLLRVNIGFKDDPEDSRNPKIMLKNNHGNQKLNADNVNILDWADIENVKLSFNPYQSPKSDHKTAWLNMLIAQIHEDPFEEEFYEVPDSATNTITFQRIDPDFKEIEE